MLVFAGGREILEHGFDIGAIWQSGKLVWGVGAAIVLGLVSIIFGLFSWRMRTFHLDDQALVIEDRFISHQTRTVLYRRIQAVDIKTPLMARLIGLCMLSIEIGSEGGVQLQYLRRTEAEELRSTLMHRATIAQQRPATASANEHANNQHQAGDQHQPIQGQTWSQNQHGAPQAPSQPGPNQAMPVQDMQVQATPAQADGNQVGPGQPPATAPGPSSIPQIDDQGHVLLRVPLTKQVLMLVTNATFAMLALLLIGVVIVSLVLQEPLVGGGLVPLVLGAVGLVWSRMVKEWGFTIRATRAGLRISRGLTDTVNQSIPRDRVHGFVLDQPLLTRPFGLWRMQVNVMGYGRDDADGNTVVLSAGTWDEAMRVIAEVWPSTTVPGQRLDDIVFEGVPRRAVWFLWWNQKVEQWALTRNFAATRHGRLHRRRTFTDHVRTQGLTLTIGPIARRMRLATVHLAAIDGPVDTEFRDLDVNRAVEVVREQPALARAMRAEREHAGRTTPPRP